MDENLQALSVHGNTKLCTFVSGLGFRINISIYMHYTKQGSSEAPRL